MRALHAYKNSLFQEDLVVEFNQALGIFPPGSIVELNTGAIAVVLEQNEMRKLRPVVCIVTDSFLMPLKKLRTVNLLSDARAPVHQGGDVDDASKPELFIVKDMPAKTCSVDLDPIKKHLFRAKRSVFSLRKSS
jgi:hypothetical protein